MFFSEISKIVLLIIAVVQAELVINIVIHILLFECLLSRLNRVDDSVGIPVTS